VPPEDPAALADRIRTFLNPNYRAAADAPFTVGSWNDSARALGDVLSGIVAAHGARCLSAG